MGSWMDNWSELLERKCATAAIRHLWQKYGIAYRPIVMVVFAMACSPGAAYWDILETLAEYALDGCSLPPWPAARWHSEICYRVLKTGDSCASAEEWLRDRAKEVRDIADGISA